MTIKYLNDKQELRHVIELENLKDKWLENLDACALDREKTLHDVLLMLLDGVRAISAKGLVLNVKSQPFHVQLYEIRPLNNTSIRTLKAIKTHNHCAEFEYDLDMMLYLKFDSSMCLGNRVNDIVEERRYLPIINGTVTGDVYMGEMPVVCVDRPLDMPDSTIVGNIHMTKNTFEALKEFDGSIEKGKIVQVSINTCVKDGNIVVRYFDNCGGMDPMLYESVMRRGACKTTKKDGSGFGVASILLTFRDIGYVINPINEPGVGFGYEISMKIETDSGKHACMDITTGETVGN